MSTDKMGDFYANIPDEVRQIIEAGEQEGREALALSVDLRAQGRSPDITRRCPARQRCLLARVWILPDGPLVLLPTARMPDAVLDKLRGVPPEAAVDWTRHTPTWTERATRGDGPVLLHCDHVHLRERLTA